MQCKLDSVEERYRRAAQKAALFIFATFSSCTFAWQAPLSAGFHFGAGTSKFSSKEIQSIESQSAWSIGANIDWRVNEWFSFSPGAIYSKESQFGFISLPLLSKLTLPLGEVDPYIFIGPYFSVVTSKASDTMKSIDFGSLQGVGCFIPLSHRFALNVDVRFKIGAMDLDTSDAVALRARSIQLNVGVALPI